MPGLIENYDDVPALRASLPMTIEVLAQSDRTDKTILVWAAGNSNESLCRPGTDNCLGNTETDHLGRPAGLLDSSSPDLFAGLMAENRGTPGALDRIRGDRRRRGNRFLLQPLRHCSGLVHRRTGIRCGGRLFRTVSR